jgi:hypothetical protein
MSIPLNLTSGQQSLLAEICRIVADVVRESGDGKTVSPEEAVRIVDQILTTAEWYDAPSQAFGVLYDKLHRTGANA